MATKKKTEKAPEVMENTVETDCEVKESVVDALSEGFENEEGITEEEKIEVKKNRSRSTI